MMSDSISRLKCLVLSSGSPWQPVRRHGITFSIWERVVGALKWGAGHVVGVVRRRVALLKVWIRGEIARNRHAWHISVRAAINRRPINSVLRNVQFLPSQIRNRGKTLPNTQKQPISKWFLRGTSVPVALESGPPAGFRKCFSRFSCRSAFPLKV